MSSSETSSDVGDENVTEMEVDESPAQQPPSAAAAAVAAPPAPEAVGDEGGDDIDSGSGSGGAAGAGKPPTRLLITKMALENFKSYGGVREIGPFHKCFSSIVGPNGSGKSNVIDAMLFVFGKRAKQLRLNKVSELIHKSDTFPDLDFTRVSVHFVDIIDDGQDEDAYEEVPGTGLVVTRTAYRDNTSKYQVDGKNATFAEVGALLRKRGIDLDNNRFLILQGEVEQIAMMKPKGLSPHEDGLLEYLEDIIGSNRYVSETEAASGEVEELNSHRTERLNRLKAAEKEKEALQGGKTQAEEFLVTEKNVRTLKNVLYQVQIGEADRNVEAVTVKADQVATELEGEREKIREEEGKLLREAERHEALAEEYREINEELLSSKRQFDEFERKNIKHTEDKKFKQGQIKTATAAAKKEAKKAKDCTAKAEQLEESLPGLAGKVEGWEDKKQKAEAALEEIQEGLRGETEDLRRQLEASQSEAVPGRKAAGELKHQLQTIECEAGILEESTVTASQKLKATETALQNLLSTAEQNRAELTQASKDGAGIKEALQEAQSQAVSAGEQVQARAAAMSSAVGACEEAKAALESQQAASGLGGKSKLVKGLLAAAGKGGALERAGVCGRLGDLGTIDPKYDVAVTTACNHLDYIVVETDAGGKACVEFLQRNDLGRASFIVLERLGHLTENMNRPFQAPNGGGGDCPRLFDLVRSSDKRFLPAFYLGLRNTMVAKDLDAATAVAYRGDRAVARVVTLDGQLIDMSGAMSGGGTSVKRGGMGGTSSTTAAAAASVGGTGVTEKQVQQLQRKADEASEALRAARASKAAADSEVKRLTQRQKQLTTLVPKLQLLLGGVDESEEQYKEQIAKLRTLTTLSPEDAAKLSQLRAEANKTQAALDKADAGLERIEKKISKLQKGILEVGGEPLKQAMHRADEAARQLDEAVAAVAAAKVGSAGEKRKADKASAAAASREKDAEKLKKEVEVMVEAFEAMELAAVEVSEKYMEVMEVARGKEAELQSMTKDYEAAKKAVKDIKSAEIDLANKLEDLNKTKADNVGKAKHWRQLLAKLKKEHKQEYEEWGSFDDDEEEEQEETMAVEGAEESKGGEEQEGGGTDDGDSEDEAGAEAKKSGADRTSKGGNTAAQGAKAKVGKGCLVELTAEELGEVNKEEVKEDLTVQEGQRDKLKGKVNMNALLEYKRKEGDYLARVKELDDITEQRNAARRRLEELRRKRLEEFMAGFGHITLKLKEMYQMITLGGDAELELVDSLDPFSEGIVFSVRPPKKSWKNIANLSGGEKTLSSLALVFALHHFKPTPLYVMDEIDAALDFKNVSIVANYIKERTKNAQFIIISLRNNMFELADRLVGIYKTHNVTKSVTINPKVLAGSIFAPQGSAAAAAAAAGGGGGGAIGGVVRPLGDSTNNR